MKTKQYLSGIIAFILGTLWTSSVMAADVTVTLTNTTHGSYFTPFLITAHDHSFHLFESGETATADLQAMAEGGDINGLVQQAGGEDNDTVANPAQGLLAPGDMVSTMLNTDTTGNTHLSLVAMILPTNDGFVGLDAMAIPSTAGTYTYYVNAYDAGTEANDEQVVGGAGGAPGTAGIPAAPGGDAGQNGTGVTNSEFNSSVHIHRGVLGDEDATGGASDLNSSIHRWLNPVAKLVIEVQ